MDNKYIGYSLLLKIFAILYTFIILIIFCVISNMIISSIINQEIFDIFIFIIFFIISFLLLLSIKVLYFSIIKYKIENDYLFVKYLFQKEKQINIHEIENIQELLNQENLYKIIFKTDKIIIWGINSELKEIINILLKENIKNHQLSIFDEIDKNGIYIKKSLIRKILITIYYMIMLMLLTYTLLFIIHNNIFVLKILFSLIIIRFIILFIKHIYYDYINCDYYFLNRDGIKIINKDVFLNWSRFSDIIYKSNKYIGQLIILKSFDGGQIKIRKSFFHGIIINKEYLISKIKNNA